MASWNFEDFLRRLEDIKGRSLEDILDHLPDLGALLREMDFRLDDLEPIEKILRAMTHEERVTPRLLEGEAGRRRRERIAGEAGTTVEAVDSFIWQFNNLVQMLEKMSPDEVTQELLSEVQPEGETWQVSPDAWKQGMEEGEPELVNEEDEQDEEELERARARASEEQLDRQLDDLLRKIARDGMSSLNAGERAFLEASSLRLRQRSAR
ncbi:MAG: hypothetical protein AB7N76_26305 [Planctomycetota bacterium]